MNDHYHGIIWIDHREAKVFHIGATGHEPVIIQAKGHGRHLQHKANVTGSGHRGVDREFFEGVIQALSNLDEILITGPGNSKLELKNYLAVEHPEVAERILAVEALDHPSDSALITFARKFFEGHEPMHSPAL